MAKYSVKMLKDEQGKPFVPVTHINAVIGEEYITSILIANKVSDGHYTITNEEIEANDIINKIIAVSFSDTENSPVPSYLKINEGQEYGIYKSDGINPLVLDSVSNSICFLGLDDDRWKLIQVGTDESSGGGHAITNENGDVMTQRGVLNFSGFNVIDDASKGATKIESKHKVIGYFQAQQKTLNPVVWEKLITDNCPITENGTYRITGYVYLNDITSVGREIGIKTSRTDDSVWHYQYHKGRYDFSYIQELNTGEDINIQIYVNPISSKDPISLEGGYMSVEKIK